MVGVAGQPRIVDDLDFRPCRRETGRPPRHCPTPARPADAGCPGRAGRASNPSGAGLQPQVERAVGTRCQISSRPQSSPSSTSLWPFMILVRLSRTKSAPNSSGRQSVGEANVLSTNNSAPPAVGQLGEGPRNRTTRNSGLVIVSTISSFVAGVRAAAVAPGIAGVDRRGRDPQPLGLIDQQQQAAAVHLVADDDMISLAALGNEGQGHRPHARGRDRGSRLLRAVRGIFPPAARNWGGRRDGRHGPAVRPPSSAAAWVGSAQR